MGSRYVVIHRKATVDPSLVDGDFVSTGRDTAAHGKAVPVCTGRFLFIRPGPTGKGPARARKSAIFGPFPT